MQCNFSRSDLARSPAVADVSAMLRLKEIRKARGIGQEALADAIGVSTASLSRIERGIQNFNRDQLAKLAETLGVDPSDLFARARNVPVVAYVGAGSEVYSIDDHEKGGSLEEVPAPPGAGPSAVGVIVRGDSMYPAYREGDVLIYDEHRPPADLLQRECVVELEDGRQMVKTISRGAGDSYTLVSHNAPPIEDVYIRWAAKVKFVIKG